MCACKEGNEILIDATIGMIGAGVEEFDRWESNVEEQAKCNKVANLVYRVYMSMRRIERDS